MRHTFTRRRLGYIPGYAAAVVTASAGTAIILLLNRAVHIPNVSLVYLPAILVIAVYFGTWPSLLAATVAVLEYDFFLLQPVFTFSIRQVEDSVAFVTFVIVAVLTSQLASRARTRSEATKRRAAESEMLYELGQALMFTRDVSQVLQAITQRIVEVFGVDRCAIFVPGAQGRLALAAETVREGIRDRASLAAAAWAFDRGIEVGLPGGGSDVLTDQRVYVPLRTADRVVGVMEVGQKHGAPLGEGERFLLTSFAAQASLVIAQMQSDEERNRLRIVEESDRLKSALLNAVSHDLRTPLASIKTSATALLLADTNWSAEQSRELLQAIDHEADRLNRLVGNLLDLSRIEAGVLRPVLDWYSMQEVVDTVLPRLEALMESRSFLVAIQPDIPPVKLDLVRIDELVVNLVENAVKYSPPTAPIELRVWYSTEGVCLAVVDHGPGVPEAQRGLVFETFFRARQHSDRNPGTGLGLAICRGVAEAHGGTLRIDDTPGGGATFVLVLPRSAVGDMAAV